MEPIREITEEDIDTDIEYSTYQSSHDDSIHRLREDMRYEFWARETEKDTSSSFCPSSCSCARCLKVVFFVMVIGLIWMAMSVPTVIYIVNQVTAT